MGLKQKLLRRERKLAYRTWLSSVKSVVYRADNGAFYTSYTFIAKNGVRVGVTVKHVKPCSEEPQSYKYYRKAYEVLTNSVSTPVSVLFITPAYKHIYKR